MPDPVNGWEQYKMYVIKHLEGVDGKLESIETKLDALKTDVTILKVKAGLYGVLGGFVVTIIVNAMIALIHAGKI